MREFLTAIAILIGIVAYVPYVRDIRSGTTKPHPFTWTFWGLLTGVEFFAQLSGGAGVGALVTGFTALVCFCFAFMGFKTNRQKITKKDWLCVAAIVLATVAWLVTNQALVAVILITIIDTLAFLPTVLKSWKNPYEETISTYVLSGTKLLIGLPALAAYTAVTMTYPATLVVTLFLFALFLYLRRAYLAANVPAHA